jgi:hypothetical protein
VSGFCSNVDVIAAVDRAVRDGVDVLSLSLGGPRDGRIDPLEEALLNADAAGVFVAVSAGNSGDIPGAVANPAAAPRPSPRPPAPARSAPRCAPPGRAGASTSPPAASPAASRTLSSSMRGRGARTSRTRSTTRATA